MVVLDTDHVSLLEWTTRPDSQRLRARLNLLTQAEVATTIISYEEQVRGDVLFGTGTLIIASD